MLYFLLSFILGFNIFAIFSILYHKNKNNKINERDIHKIMLSNSYKYYRSELKKLLPIDKHGIKLKLTSSNGETKVLNLSIASFVAIGKFIIDDCK